MPPSPTTLAVEVKMWINVLALLKCAYGCAKYPQTPENANRRIHQYLGVPLSRFQELVPLFPPL